MKYRRILVTWVGRERDEMRTGSIENSKYGTGKQIETSMLKYFIEGVGERLSVRRVG